MIGNHETDFKFFNELIEKLEKNNGFSLCVYYRDVLPGVSRDDALQILLEERCECVIAILSKASVTDRFTKHLIDMAHTSAISK